MRGGPLNAARTALLPLQHRTLGLLASVGLGVGSCLWSEDPGAARVLVVWSPEAAASASRAGHLLDLRSRYLVDLTDTVLADSGVTVTVELAGVEVLDAAEPGGTTIDLLDRGRADLADPASALARLRAEAEADLVVWMVDTDTAPSGAARRLDGDGITERYDALAVVHWDADEQVFPHELFHLYGADHSRLQLLAEGLSDEGYAHGYTAPGVLAYTIMSDASECTWTGVPLSSCAPVPRLSNPAVLAWGEPLGDAATADNACVVQQRGRWISRLYEMVAGTEPPWDAPLAPVCPVVLARGRDLVGRTCLAESWEGEGCTEVRGSIRVEDPERLRGVERVTGDLTLAGPTVTSLSALTALRSVGGTLSVRDTALVDLAGLEDLEEVGGLVLESDPALRGLGALSLEEVPGSLLVVGTGVEHLDGPTGLQRAGVLWVMRNPALRDLSALATLRGTSGGIVISDNPVLEDCALPSLDPAAREALVAFGNGEGCRP